MSVSPLLSVIIPVYNTAEFLPACLDSVLKQGLNGMEIIVIDDGSTDGSREIIEQYSARHPNLLSLHQSRQRQGAARNLGIEHARGRYIAFADSDDLLADNAYRHMVTVARLYDSDMVLGAYQSFSGKSRWFELPLHQRLISGGQRCTDIFADPALLEDISVCSKMVKRSVIDTYQLRFPAGYAGEDLRFSCELLLRCRTIAICPEIVYLCRRKRATASSSRIDRKFFALRQQTTLSLARLFEQCDAAAIYPWLLRSEIRKLVGSRLARVVRELPGHEQEEIFAQIREMALRIGRDGVYRPPDYFNAVHRICIRLLQEDETEALRAFEQSLDKIFFLRRIGDSRVRREIAGLLPPLYLLGARRLLGKMGRSLFPH